MAQQELDRCVIRILDPEGQSVGAGFVIGSHLAVTCAHVIEDAQSSPGDVVTVAFLRGGSRQSARVLQKAWAPSRAVAWSSEPADDLAFLVVDDLPAGVEPAILGTANARRGHRFSTHGAQNIADALSRWASGVIGEPVIKAGKSPMLQCGGAEIGGGMSGAPLLDEAAERVVGIICEVKGTGAGQVIWATTADCIAARAQLIDPAPRLWPDEYGPNEYGAYLQYLITKNETLKLTGGQPVPLQQVYVSLRADEMSEAEREAEYTLYYQEVKRHGSDVIAQQRVLAAHPIMYAMEAQTPDGQREGRQYERLFGETERTALNLADIVGQHARVVVLGHPGSGKTTLGKWLVLQHALARRNGDLRVHVPLDFVDPGSTDDHLVDLGRPRLPIFVRIARYAEARWDGNGHDTGLPLEQYFGLQYQDEADLPKALSPDVLGQMARDHVRDGQALVILDGLDEVGNLDQRVSVMLEANRFIEEQAALTSALADNREGSSVLVTSRLVGYQVQPLKHLAHFVVQDMSPRAIGAFCLAWMRNVEDKDRPQAEADAHAQLLYRVIMQAHANLREMAGNPLLLSIIAQVFCQSGHNNLPTTRATLFDRAAAVLFSWRQGDWSEVNIDERLLRDALGAVAMYLHGKPGQSEAPAGDIGAELRDAFRAAQPDRPQRDIDRQVRAVLESAKRGDNFLVARGEGVYGFLHRALQEYFAAWHLTPDDRPAQVEENLARLVLDPTWREPVLLGIGNIGRQEYIGYRTCLPRVFEAILNAHDDIGTLLPRREMVAAAGWAECETMFAEANGIACQIAERLLQSYFARPSTSGGVQAGIQRAFRMLRRSPAAGCGEDVLCAALASDDEARRFAAAEIILQSEWDSVPMVRALLQAWSSYAGPAGTLLSALDAVHRRQPALFRAELLPMRRALEGGAQGLWQRAVTSPWSDIIRILYLTPTAEMAPDAINRDSPLTDTLVRALGQADAAEALATLRTELLGHAIAPGTAKARDAQLALAALGIKAWGDDAVRSAGEGGALLRPFFAAAEWMTMRDDARTLDTTRDLRFDLGRARAARQRTDGARSEATRRQEITDAVTLARALTSMTRHEDVLDMAENLERTLAFDPARAPEGDLYLSCFRDRTLMRSQGRDLDTEVAALIRSALVRWAPERDIVRSLRAALRAVEQMQVASGDRSPLGEVREAVEQALDPDWQEQSANTESQSGLKLALTLEGLPRLVDALEDGDDDERDRARTFLDADRTAEAIGKPVIDALANLHKKYFKKASHKPRVDTYLGRALLHLTHDVPDWMVQWIEESMSAEDTPAEWVLYCAEKMTPQTFEQLVSLLPTIRSSTNIVLLEVLNELAWNDAEYRNHRDSQRLTAESWSQALWTLMDWLNDEDTEPAVCDQIVHILGGWPNLPVGMAEALIARLEDGRSRSEAETKALLDALSLMASHRLELAPRVQRILLQQAESASGAEALVRLGVAIALRQYQAERDQAEESDEARPLIRGRQPKQPAAGGASGEPISDLVQRQHEAVSHILRRNLAGVLSDPARYLTALLDAGGDGGYWEGPNKYHPVLAIAARDHLVQHPDLLPLVLDRFSIPPVSGGYRAELDTWAARRMAVAVIAAVAEVMQTKLREQVQLLGFDLEALLIDCTRDVHHHSRRFALTALSYLHNVSERVAEALMAGCQDEWIVQRDALRAAGSFRSITGDPVPVLAQALTGKSVVTACAVAGVLGRLGESLELRDRVNLALQQALRELQQRWGAGIPSQEIIRADTLYDALLQVNGLQG